MQTFSVSRPFEVPMTGTEAKFTTTGDSVYGNSPLHAFSVGDVDLEHGEMDWTLEFQTLYGTQGEEEDHVYGKFRANQPADKSLEANGLTHDFTQPQTFRDFVDEELNKKIRALNGEIYEKKRKLNTSRKIAGIGFTGAAVLAAVSIKFGHDAHIMSEVIRVEDQTERDTSILTGLASMIGFFVGIGSRASVRNYRENLSKLRPSKRRLGKIATELAQNGVTFVEEDNG